MTENKYIELTKTIIELLEDLKEQQNIFINRNGVITNRNGAEHRCDIFDIENEDFLKRILDCMEEIKILYEPLKSVYNIHSYGGKHYIERYRHHINKQGNNYISNGEFILAMLLSGYKHKHNNGPNMCFRGRKVKEWEKKIYKI